VTHTGSISLVTSGVESTASESKFQ